MAGSVCKVIILGHLGADPALKYLPSGQAVCEMRIATSEKFKDKQDQLQERTEWHTVVAWGKTAENCGEYLKKGRAAYVEGKLQTRSWDDKDGQKRYKTEIVAERVVFLGGGGEGRSEGGGDRGGRGDSLPPVRPQPGRDARGGGWGEAPSGDFDDSGPGDDGDDRIPF